LCGCFGSRIFYFINFWEDADMNEIKSNLNQRLEMKGDY